MWYLAALLAVFKVGPKKGMLQYLTFIFRYIVHSESYCTLPWFHSEFWHLLRDLV